MDQKFPFTSYDFWAYLSAGFLLLFVADYVAGTGLLSRQSWTVIQVVVAVSSAYAAGHLIASVSELLFERLLVGKLLGQPSLVLFGNGKAPRWVRTMLPGYFKALPHETQKSAVKRGAEAGVQSGGESLFWPAYENARCTASVMSRLDNFLNLYGFCRNIALVSFINAALLYLDYRWGVGPLENLYWSWAALALGVGMTLRYLKFYRRYAVEVFTAYAYGRER